MEDILELEAARQVCVRKSIKLSGRILPLMRKEAATKTNDKDEVRAEIKTLEEELKIWTERIERIDSKLHALVEQI